MTAALRAVRAEFTKLSWRSPTVSAMVPLAVVIPIVLNAAIAQATQSDLLYGGGVIEPDNAGYWIIVFTPFILMLGGVSSTCGEYSNRTLGLYLSVQPRRWILPVAKLACYGLIGVVASLVTTLVIVAGFPSFYPDVWGNVSASSPEGIRLIVGIPLLTLFTCALGIGVSLLVHRAGTVVMLVLLWRFGLEWFATYVPGDLGQRLQQFSPFKNGEIGAGQAASIKTVFGGPNGSLAYFAVICAVIFVLGLVRLYRADVRT